jgi:hypothetical protein
MVKSSHVGAVSALFGLLLLLLLLLAPLLLLLAVVVGVMLVH